LLLADKKIVTSPSKRGQKESTEGGKRKEAKRKKNYKEGKIRHNLKKKKKRHSKKARRRQNHSDCSTWCKACSQ